MSVHLKGSRAFTLLELLAVIALISAVFFISTSKFTNSRARLSDAAYRVTQDIQSLVNESIRQGKIHRLSINTERDGYILEAFELPPPPPKPDDREGQEKYEELQRKIEESWKGKEKATLTRLDRGFFRELKKRDLGFRVKFKTFINSQNSQENAPWEIFFYPSGEVDQVLMIIEDSTERKISLVVNPLSGVVKTVLGELNVAEWKKQRGIKE